MRDYRYTFTAATPEELARQLEDAKAVVNRFDASYGRDSLGWWCSSLINARQRSGLGFHELVEEIQAAYKAARNDVECEELDAFEDA